MQKTRLSVVALPVYTRFYYDFQEGRDDLERKTWCRTRFEAEKALFATTRGLYALSKTCNVFEK